MRLATFLRARRPASPFAAVIAALLLTASSLTHAEGSRTLYPSTYTAARASMDLTSNSLFVGQVSRRQFIYVHARAGEFIVLGSRNRIATGTGGDVRIYFDAAGNYGPKGGENLTGAPANGALVFSCDGSGAVTPANSFFGTTLGAIGTRAEELAGPNSADNSVTVTNGFVPCAYAVPATGIYGLAFSGRGASNTNRNIIDPPAVLADSVSAWDVTVRADATSVADINGRVFTYAWAGFTGANGDAFRLNHTLYYVTSDGYRYEQISRGIDPNGYAMYANRSGFLDSGAPLYKDVRPGVGAVPQLVNPVLGAAAGISAEAPQFPVFFSSVATTAPHAAEVDSTLARLGIPAVPPVPQLGNVDYVGNVAGSTSTVGAGGTFTFDTVNTLSYEIVISRDGIDFDPANALNRVITGVALNGSHSVYWNGRDNSGANFPASATNYPYRIAGRNGEVHFPIIDAEANPFGGPTINKLNGTPGSTVYYDDRGYISRNGFAVGQNNGLLCGAGATQPQPVPAFSLIGVDSSAQTGGIYYRTWSGGNPNVDCGTGGFGDAKGLDSWALEQTAAIVRDIEIIAPLAGVDVGTTISVAAAAFPGQTVNGSFAFRNDGDTTATGVTYALTIGDPGNAYCPASVTFPLVPAGVTATFNPLPACTVTFTGMPVSLAIGQSLLFNFSYPAPAPGTVPVRSEIQAGNETAPPGTSPNVANAATIITIADVFTTITVPATAATGSTVNGTLQFGNTSAATATAEGVIYVATIGTPGSCPAGVAFVLPGGATFAYDNATCAVSFTGLPTLLDPAQTINITFSYTAPATAATIPVSSSISTTTPETATTNNTSSGQTVVAPATAALTISKVANESGVIRGGTASFTIVIGNSGPATADNVSVTDPTPAGLTFVSNAGDCVTAFPCSLGSLPVGETRTITTVYAVPLGYAGPNPILNTATVSSPTDPGGPRSDDASTPVESTTFTVAKGAPTLSIDANGDGVISVGDTLTYTVTFTNTGTVAMTGVVVSDPLLTPSSISCTSVAPSATCVLVGTHVVTLAEGAAGQVVNIANASTTTPGVCPSGDTSPACNPTVTTPVVSAALAIVKTAVEASVIPGNTASYTIAVTNNGPSDAANVVVTDTTPAGLTFVSNTGACTTAFPCSLGTVPAGETRTITTTFSVPANYAGANPIVNIASVTSPTDPGGPRQDDATTPLGTPTATLAIVKTAVEASVIPGNTASYTIAVTNNGPSDAANVVVSDTTPAGLTFVSNAGACTTAFPCNLGTVPAGETRTITTTFQVPADYAGASPIVNLASVTSPTDPNGPREDDATTPLGTPSAVLAIVKTAVEASVVPGDTASYTIAVTNNGPSDAANVVVTDTTPAGLTFVSNTGACTTAFPCNLGTIPAGETRTITTTFSVPANYAGANPIVNIASVTSPTDPGGPRQDDATTPLGTPSAVLAIVKTAVEASVVPGDTASYTIAVTNNGPSDAANVVVTDTTPAGLTFVSNTGACTTAFPCSLGTVPAGETRTITTTFSVPANYAGANPIVNIASVTSPTDPGGPRQDDATTPVGTPNAVLAIVKTAVEASVAPGNTASYTIAVTNNGPSDAANVVVTDTTPAGLTFVSNTGACASAFPCNLGTVPAGETRTITTTFQVPSNYAGANPIVNIASVTSPTDPGGPRQDDATMPIGAAIAELLIEKTANVQQALPGETITYTIVVGNAGPSNASNVIVTDPVPAGLNFIANTGDCTNAFPCSLGTIPPGQTRVITSTYLVRFDNPSGAPIVNVATATSPNDPGGPISDDAIVPTVPAGETVAVPVDNPLALLLLMLGAAGIAGRALQRRRRAIGG